MKRKLALGIVPLVLAGGVLLGTSGAAQAVGGGSLTYESSYKDPNGSGFVFVYRTSSGSPYLTDHWMGLVTTNPM